MGQIHISTQEALATNEGGGNLWTTLKRLFGTDCTESDTRTENNAGAIPRSLASMPIAKRVRLAFEALPPNEIECRLITALLQRPKSDAKVLSAACGWQGTIWQTYFGLMCQKRSAWLWPTDLSDEPEAQFLPGLLADYDPVKGSFGMKADVAAVFRKMDLG